MHLNGERFNLRIYRPKRRFNPPDPEGEDLPPRDRSESPSFRTESSRESEG
jgi:hypothetical protein